MKFKFKFSLILILTLISFSFSQETKENQEPFNYVEIKEEFDLIVDFAFVNPECATKDQNFYSVIIGTTVIGDYIERISVLVPCLENEFLQGDLVSIKPIKTPKKNIAYLTRNYKKDGQEYSDVFGSEFRAVWGEVIK